MGQGLYFAEGWGGSIMYTGGYFTNYLFWLAHLHILVLCLLNYFHSCFSLTRQVHVIIQSFWFSGGTNFFPSPCSCSIFTWCGVPIFGGFALGSRQRCTLWRCCYSLTLGSGWGSGFRMGYNKGGVVYIPLGAHLGCGPDISWLRRIRGRWLVWEEIFTW